MPKKYLMKSAIAKRKKSWIDFDAQSKDENALFDLIIETVKGKQTKNEINNFREIAIFKDGVTL